MPITIDETYGRQLGNRRGERGYIIRGTESESDAKTALLNEAPSTLGSLVLDDLNVKEIAGVNGGAFTGRARYVSPDRREPQTNEETFSLSTEGGTQHITQSLETIGKHAAAGTAPDFKGAIGVTDNGDVKGVDIPVRGFDFTKTIYKPAADVTAAYVENLYLQSTTVNSDSIDIVINDSTGATMTFPAGTLLLLRTRMKYRPDQDDFAIEFDCSANPNKTGLSVGDITGIDKKGHEYLWAHYTPVEDTDAKALTQRPTAAYVERVFETSTFATLGIGTTTP